MKERIFVFYLSETFTWCEVIRCDEDFTYRGAIEKYVLEIRCLCHCMQSRLITTPISRDSDGDYVNKNQFEWIILSIPGTNKISQRHFLVVFYKRTYHCI
ncbi:MAG: hypothetical protein SOV91_02045 [Eubacteriales bacterium]|nr:hypothetical protein [Eubacteriales bacterium]